MTAADDTARTEERAGLLLDALGVPHRETEDCCPHGVTGPSCAECYARETYVPDTDAEDFAEAHRHDGGALADDRRHRHEGPSAEAREEAPPAPPLMIAEPWVGPDVTTTFATRYRRDPDPDKPREPVVRVYPEGEDCLPGLPWLTCGGAKGRADTLAQAQFNADAALIAAGWALAEDEPGWREDWRRDRDADEAREAREHAARWADDGYDGDGSDG